MLNRRSRVPLCWVTLLHLISNFSAPQLIRAPRSLRPDVAFPTTTRLSPSPTVSKCLQLQLIRGSKSPFGLMWLSPHHIVYNSVRSLTATNLTSVLTELYNSSKAHSVRLLDLWDRMFDRHQAEITVMQFIRSLSSGASVYECTMGIFFYLVPFRQLISAHCDFLSKLPFECVTSSRCITLEWHFWPGRRLKYNIRSDRKLQRI